MGVNDRRDRDFKRREEDILDAAFDLFADHGIESVTIDMIAETAEVGKGTIYKHFTGKNDIFASLVIRQGSGLTKALGRLDTTIPVVSRIKKMIRVFWESHAGDMKTFEISRKCHQLVVEEDLPEPVLAEYTRLNDLKKKFVRTLFQQAIDEEIFMAVDVDNLIVASMGLYIGMLDVALENQVQPSEELYALLENMIFKGFMR
ncbi:MAG: TetR/AcrR family transcriptional regulator [Desulfobacula sp.]|nr:TetR/AcrR family transcriptional regulator [Desulfobacula sp.]